MNATAPSAVLALAASGTSDGVVGEPVDVVVLLGVVGAVELVAVAVVDGVSTGGADGVVQAATKLNMHAVPRAAVVARTPAGAFTFPPASVSLSAERGQYASAAALAGQ